MAPTRLTLLCLPAEIRNKIWRFALPRRPDLEVDACLPGEECFTDPSPPCKFVDLKRYNWKDESLLVVCHQTREEIEPWIVREKRILKFCTDKCLERYLRETGDDRTSRGGLAKALDDIKVHLVVGLGPPPHSRMGKAVAKMRVAGEVQKLIARLRPEIITVDLMPIEIIQEAGTTQEMHVMARFVVKARRAFPRVLLRDNPPTEPNFAGFKSRRTKEDYLDEVCRRQEDDRRTLLRSRRTLRTTRSTSELLLRETLLSEVAEAEAEAAAQHRAGVKRTRQPRARAMPTLGGLLNGEGITSRPRSANERSMFPLGPGRGRLQQAQISDYLQGVGLFGDSSDEDNVQEAHRGWSSGAID